MPQSGYTPIQIYASGVSGHIPSAGNLVNSALGAEIAINYADGKLFYKDNNGVVQQLTGGGGGSGVTTFSAGTTGFTPSTATSGTVTLGGILNVANGGTGQNNLTTGALLLGNGAGGVNALSGGTVGYVPTWNGTTWYSAPSGSSGVLSSNNTWTGINNFTNTTTFSNTPTAGGYQVLTTSTGATLANNNLWTGANSFASNITANGFTVLTTNTGAGLGNNNSWTGTNAFSITPTGAGSYTMLTTNTGGQLSGTNNWSGQNTFSNNGSGNGTPIYGSTSGSTASTGYVGELISATANNVSCTSATTVIIASIVLTPGDWDINGLVECANNGYITAWIGGINTSGGTLITRSIGLYSSVDIGPISMPVPYTPFQTSSNVTVNLLLNVSFTSGTPLAGGNIYARRIR
jgi:hypothetical protein